MVFMQMSQCMTNQFLYIYIFSGGRSNCCFSSDVYELLNTFLREGDQNAAPAVMFVSSLIHFEGREIKM